MCVMTSQGFSFPEEEIKRQEVLMSLLSEVKSGLGFAGGPEEVHMWVTDVSHLSSISLLPRLKLLNSSCIHTETPLYFFFCQ